MLMHRTAHKREIFSVDGCRMVAVLKTRKHDKLLFYSDIEIQPSRGVSETEEKWTFEFPRKPHFYWSGRLDSNQRPLTPQANALPESRSLTSRTPGWVSASLLRNAGGAMLWVFLKQSSFHPGRIAHILTPDCRLIECIHKAFAPAK